MRPLCTDIFPLVEAKWRTEYLGGFVNATKPNELNAWRHLYCTRYWICIQVKLSSFILKVFQITFSAMMNLQSNEIAYELNFSDCIR